MFPNMYILMLLSTLVYDKNISRHLLTSVDALSRRYFKIDVENTFIITLEVLECNLNMIDWAMISPLFMIY